MIFGVGCFPIFQEICIHTFCRVIFYAMDFVEAVFCFARVPYLILCDPKLVSSTVWGEFMFSDEL